MHLNVLCWGCVPAHGERCLLCETHLAGFMLAAGLAGWWAKRRCIGKSPGPVPVALKSYKSRRFNGNASRCTTAADDSDSSSTFG